MADTATKQGQWQMLFGYLLGNQATWVVDSGLKAGLFGAIEAAGGGGIGEDALASVLGYHPRYVSVWCRAAFAFELLDWDEADGYRLAPYMSTFLLDSTDPQFMGGRLQFYTALYEDFRALPASLRTGRIWPRSEHVPWLLEALKNLTKPDATVFAETVIPQAPDTLARLEAGGAILELGSGGGHALVHFARRFPASRVSGLELDGPSIELARRTIEEAGLGDRIQIRPVMPISLTKKPATIW